MFSSRVPKASKLRGMRTQSCDAVMGAVQAAGESCRQPTFRSRVPVTSMVIAVGVRGRRLLNCASTFSLRHGASGLSCLSLLTSLRWQSTFCLTQEAARCVWTLGKGRAGIIDMESTNKRCVFTLQALP